MAYEGHDGYKLYIIGVASGTFELEGRFYTRFIKSIFIFPKALIMVEQLENTENNAQSMPYVPCVKRRKLGKEITRKNNNKSEKENNKEEKRKKVNYVPE